MGDGKPRAQRRAVAAIEDEKLLRVAVAERMHHAAAQILSGPDGAKPLAFDAEKCNLVEGIDRPQ
jgi:hypothetical protein